MGKLYLVRHGQASFGAADYDQLSPLGQRQCERLGTYLAERDQRFDAVFTGTLRRHQQSLAGIAQGLSDLPPTQVLPGLNEYDSEAVVHAIHPSEPVRPQTPEAVRQHFRWLRQGLLSWMAGQSTPVGMPRHADFVAGVAQALALAREHAQGDVLIVSSGGPISAAIGLVLGLAPQAVVELNMRIRNSAVTEFQATPKRHNLLTFNTLPHLDGPGLDEWVTYA
jgi:broad specificity phosphatase PhoE